MAGKPKFDLSAFTQDPVFLKAVQSKLGELVGTSSGYLESLPKQVQDRISVVRHLQIKKDSLSIQYQAELQALEKKYQALYQPFYDQRSAIITGAQEPSVEEISAAEKILEEEEEKDEQQEGEEKKEAETTEEKGIPEFWLTTLQHADEFADIITDEDREALKYLTDIKSKEIESGPSFEVEFHFAENPFFSNNVLRKAYILEANGNKINYDHIEPAIIEWKEGKSLVMKKVTTKIPGKTLKNGKKSASRTETREQPQPSFFHFFNPQVREDDEQYEEIMGEDYELGLQLKDDIIPDAVHYFTGDNSIGDFDMDEEGEEEDEDEDDDGEAAASRDYLMNGEDEEYNEEEDGDFDPASAPPAQECKQQ